MKNSRFFLMLATSSLLTMPALAAPVFMLQFGSFETRQEADTRLNELRAKHGGVLKTTPLGVREVTLPPDNLTVYRTQAGPLETRADAQSVCSQLASNGDECYVVETAMAPTLSPAATQVAEAVAAPLAPQAAPPVVAAAIAPRDPQNVAALQRVTAPAAAPVAAATASPALKQALDEAAAEQAGRDAVAAAPTPPDAKPEGSFWSRLNPFSSDKEATPAPVKPVAAVVPPAPEPVAAPVAAVETAPVALPVVEAAPVEAAPVVASADPLNLPPPAPLVMQAPAAAVSPAPVIPPQPTGVVPPASNGPIVMNNMPFKSGQSVPPGGGEQLADARGAVRVDEAQRVPLSSMTPIRPPVELPPGAPAVDLHPSATLGQKTLWAHVGSFADTQAALVFWDQYRRAHPDFPVVRVRVSSSYQALLRGRPQVSLRVGPFARTSSIKNLCTTIAQQKREEKLTCGHIIDSGVALTPSGDARTGYLSGSRYKR